MAGSSCAFANHHQLDSILKKLRRQLLKKEWRFGEADAGLLSRTREFLVPEWFKVGDPELLNNLKKHMEELCNQWQFLRIFVVEVKKWSDGDEAVNSCGSLILKADAKADEIAEKLTIASRKKYITKQPSILMNDFQVFAGEIYDLNSQITPVFCSILDSFSSLKLHSPLRDLILWIEFAKSTAENLNLVDPNAGKHLKSLTDFIDSLHQRFPSGLMIPCDDGQNHTVIEGFFARAASVVFRVACLCHSFRFGETRELGCTVDLLDGICYATPQFSLEFLKALNKISHRSAAIDGAFVIFFFKSTLRQYSSYSDALIFGELVDLIVFLINRPEEPIDQQDEEYCCLEEIEQLIVEIIPALNYGDRRRNWLLEKKIWLRKVEFFLKEKPFSEMIFDLENSTFSKVRNGVKEMRQYELKKDEITRFTELVWKDIKYIRECKLFDEEEEGRISVSLLLQKVVPLRALTCLMVLLNRNKTTIAFIIDQLEDLVSGLELFLSSVTDKKVKKGVHCHAFIL